LKSLIKYQYQFVLFVTLILGYSQLFVPLSNANAFNKPVTSEHYKTQVSNAAYGSIVYFEEERADEDDKFSKKVADISSYCTLLSNSIWQLAKCINIISIGSKSLPFTHSVHLSYRVLRL
jgi:hypothetical protein